LAPASRVGAPQWCAERTKLSSLLADLGIPPYGDSPPFDPSSGSAAFASAWGTCRLHLQRSPDCRPRGCADILRALTYYPRCPGGALPRVPSRPANSLAESLQGDPRPRVAWPRPRCTPAGAHECHRLRFRCAVSLRAHPCARRETQMRCAVSV